MRGVAHDLQVPFINSTGKDHMQRTLAGDALLAAGVALFDMATEGRGATQLDRAHRTPLGTTEPVGVALPMLGSAAAEGVRHFQWRAHARVQKYSGAAG